MEQCKQLEKFYTEYVCGLLNEEQVARIDGHLRGCSICAHEIESLQETLRLTEEAKEIPIPPAVLDNIEKNVYKRLATEPPTTKREHFFSRFFTAFRSNPVKLGPTWIFHSALATLALVSVISITTIFINQDQLPDIPIQSTHERIELYRQAEIRNNRTEALETRHLKGNDRLATLQLLVIAETH